MFEFVISLPIEKMLKEYEIFVQLLDSNTTENNAK